MIYNIYIYITMQNVDPKTMLGGSTDLVESKIVGAQTMTEPYG